MYAHNWSEPHNDYDNGPYTQRIMVCLNLSLYHLPQVYCNLVSETHIHPEMLHVFHVVHMRNCHDSRDLIVCHGDCRQRQG